MKKIYINLFIVLLLSNGALLAQTVRTDVLTPNGPVNAIARKGNVLYFGGEFSFVGPNTPYGVAIDHYLGKARPFYAKPNGPVTKVVADGTGGWFIKGTFTKVGNANRDGLAKINADGSLNPLDIRVEKPNSEFNVYDIAAAGNMLYIVGFFDKVNGQPRSSTAAFDATTGALLPWAPQVGTFVLAAAVYGNSVYLGGSFNKINDSTRLSVGAVDATTGATLPWKPAYRSNAPTVFTMAANASSVYIGGQFHQIDGVQRNYGAAFDAQTGALTPWDPEVDNTITKLKASEDIVFVGGDFMHIHNFELNGYAFVNAQNAGFLRWNVQVTNQGRDPFGSAQIEDAAFQNNTIYVGGQFTTIRGVARRNLAAINATSGEITTWDPNADALVNSVAVSGTSVYAGGNFSSIGGGAARNNLAAIDLNTGQLTSWDPSTNGVVNALLVGDNVVYAGGKFSVAGGQFRESLAALDMTVGAATIFNARIDAGNVNALAIDGNYLYLGGFFPTVNGVNRNSLAAVDRSSGALITSWRSSAVAENGTPPTINAMVAYSGNLYIGGLFAPLFGEKNYNLMSMSLSNGAANGWAAKTDATVYALTVINNDIIAGGAFTTVGGVQRKGVAAIDASTAVVSPWDPQVNSYDGRVTVRSLAAYNRTVAIGGRFNFIQGQRRNLAGAVDYPSAQVSPWHPDPSGSNFTNAEVYAVFADGEYLAVGGNFNNIDYKDVSYLGLFRYNPFSQAPPMRRPSSTVTVTDIGSNYGLYPNPVRNKATLFLNSPTATRKNYTVVNVAGVVISRGTAVLVKGSNNVDFDFTTLPPGSYVIYVEDGGATNGIKFIKK